MFEVVRRPWPSSRQGWGTYQGSRRYRRLSAMGACYISASGSTMHKQPCGQEDDSGGPCLRPHTRQTARKEGWG
jgi:hypothetical protein